MTDVPPAPNTHKPMTARDAQAALLEQLLGDVDHLLRRVETVAPTLEAAAIRFEQSVQVHQAAFEASAEAAKQSIGEWIARRTNEVTSQALAKHQREIDQAMATALGRALLAAQGQAHQVPRAPAPPAPASRHMPPWFAATLGAAVALAAAAALWIALGARPG